MLGMREYDALVPDNSPRGRGGAGRRPGRSRVACCGPRPGACGRADDARRCDRDLRGHPARARDAPGGAHRHAATAERAAGAARADRDHPVARQQRARTTYLTGCGPRGGILDTATERLRAGAARGRLPVQSLLDSAIEWCDQTLASRSRLRSCRPRPRAGTAPAPGATRSSDVVANEIVPAISRWRDQLVDAARPVALGRSGRARARLPGGDADYLNAIAVHTTLPLTADELHRAGATRSTALSERARELGAKLGMTDLGEILAAVARLGDRAQIRTRRSPRRGSRSRAPRRGRTRSCPSRCPDRARSSRCRRPSRSPGMAPHYSPPQPRRRGRGRTGSTPSARPPAPGGISRRSRSTRRCRVTTRSSPGSR